MDNNRFPTWVYLLGPIILLIGLVFVFLYTNPVVLTRTDLPPVEDLHIQKLELPEHGLIKLDVINSGPDPLTIAQVLVDDAYWSFVMNPQQTLGTLETGVIFINYPWVDTEAHEIVLISSSGATFDVEIEMAVMTPTKGANQAFAYALVGVYIGIIPVGLGLLWYPAIRRFGPRAMNFILSLTIGLLVFLLIDTYLEMHEVSQNLPGVFQGLPLGIFMALFTWLGIMAIGSNKIIADRTSIQGRAFVALMIAVGIGFHNLGEGLVVGAAFASGEAALGSFLVVGFILHNITEGIGIVSPVAKDNQRFRWFLLVLLLAGGPAVIGTLIGGFAYSPLLTVIFLGIGVGAILQVIVEVGGLIQRDAIRRQVALISWTNLLGLLVGVLIMYLTAFMVKF